MCVTTRTPLTRQPSEPVERAAHILAGSFATGGTSQDVQKGSVMLQVKIIPNAKGAPPGKLADAEIHFADVRCSACEGDGTIVVSDSGPLAGSSGICVECDGTGIQSGLNPLAGLRLVGFAIWERRTGKGRNVTFPARAYSVNGERRSFALLRPVSDTAAQDRVRDLILQAYAEHDNALSEAV